MNRAQFRYIQRLRKRGDPLTNGECALMDKLEDQRPDALAWRARLHARTLPGSPAWQEHLKTLIVRPKP